MSGQHKLNWQKKKKKKKKRKLPACLLKCFWPCKQKLFFVCVCVCVCLMTRITVHSVNCMHSKIISHHNIVHTRNPHTVVVDLLLLVEGVVYFSQALGFKSPRVSVGKQGACHSQRLVGEVHCHSQRLLEEDGDDKRLVQLKLVSEADGVASPDPV